MNFNCYEKETQGCHNSYVIRIGETHLELKGYF